MSDYNYIAPVALSVFALFSVFHAPFRVAGVMIFLAQMISFAIAPLDYIYGPDGISVGTIFHAFISVLMMFLLLLMYDQTKQKILLILSAIAGLFSVVHLFKIGGHVEWVATSWWFQGFNLRIFYDHYHNIQLCLTVAMIVVFIDSGIKGMINVFRRSKHYFKRICQTALAYCRSLHLFF